MLAVAATIVGTPALDSWKQLLEGLFWGGLRIAESMDLSWEPGDGFHVVDIDRPPAAFLDPSQRGQGQSGPPPGDRPRSSFQLLRKVQLDQRTGPVFCPPDPAWPASLAGYGGESDFPDWEKGRRRDRPAYYQRPQDGTAVPGCPICHSP